MSSSEDPFLLHHHNLLYHVPQHSRREKLRFQTDSSSLPNPMAHFTAGTGLLQIQPPQGNFSLTLSPAAALLPLGPFTGYAAVLNRSRFLDPARQLLEEVCEVAGGEQFAGDPPEVMSLDYEVGPDDQQWKKARLISMIDEVCRRYRIYYQQVQNVITSFEMVAGLRTAAPYVSLALSSMSKHFRCLKNMMSNQLNVTNKDSGKEGISRTEISSFGMCLQQDGNSNNLDSYRQPHAWRPQRGLPERAIAVLRAWLFEHFLHPYPTDVDKQMLAKQAGLTRNQVSNWFINARVRLWKPMVEEIHNLEMRQLQKTVAPNNKNQIAHNKQASKPSSSTATSSSNQPPQNSFIQRNQNPSSRSLNNELDYIAHHIEEPFKYAYNDFSSQDVGRNAGSVSLTLGLHQNSGVRLPEPLPLNVARRFGLEDCNDTYVVGAFEGQDRRFGKDIGGHLLHDFVG